MDNYFKYGFFIAVIAIIALVYKGCDDAKKYKDAQIAALNLNRALTDTLRHFQTKEGDWGAEKRTMQAELSVLKSNNVVLTENQKRLIKTVEEQNKQNQTIAAALIELGIKVDSMVNKRPISVTDSTVRFASTDKDFKYDVTISNVKPIDLKVPELKFNNVSFENTQTINFHWENNRQQGYPISFSVVNSNPYFKVHDIQSYAIPELNRANVKPTFWQKVGNFGKTSMGNITIFGVGVGVGAILYSTIQN